MLKDKFIYAYDYELLDERSNHKFIVRVNQWAMKIFKDYNVIEFRFYASNGEGYHKAKITYIE